MLDLADSMSFYFVWDHFQSFATYDAEIAVSYNVICQKLSNILDIYVNISSLELLIAIANTLNSYLAFNALNISKTD